MHGSEEGQKDQEVMEESKETIIDQEMDPLPEIWTNKEKEKEKVTPSFLLFFLPS